MKRSLGRCRCPGRSPRLAGYPPNSCKAGSWDPRTSKAETVTAIDHCRRRWTVLSFCRSRPRFPPPQPVSSDQGSASSSLFHDRGMVRNVSQDTGGLLVSRLVQSGPLSNSRTSPVVESGHCVHQFVAGTLSRHWRLGRAGLRSQRRRGRLGCRGWHRKKEP